MIFGAGLKNKKLLKFVKSRKLTFKEKAENLQLNAYINFFENKILALPMKYGCDTFHGCYIVLSYLFVFSTFSSF